MVDSNAATNLPYTTQMTSSSLRPPALADKSGLTFKMEGMIKEYYGPMRFFGYASSVFTDWYIDKKKADFERKVLEHKISPIAGFDPEKKFESDVYKNKFAKIEAGYFAAMTSIYAIRDWRDMVKYFRGAIAAEQRQAPSAIEGTDILRSNNPIIQTAVRRFTTMNVTRLASDSMFLWGMNAGLIGMFTRITAERTLFNQKTAYDRLEKLFEEVQVYNFDLHSKSRVAKELGNVVQQCQKDHDRAGWSFEVINHYNPLFEQMADAVVRKEMGLTETVYLLGELMTKRLTLDDSLNMFNNIRRVGLDGLRGIKGTAPVAIIEPAETPEAQKMTTTQFANKYLGQAASAKSALERGQRSFGDMLKAQSVAEHSL